MARSPKTSSSQNTALKSFRGKVVSTSMKDTVVVVIERYEKHPRYGKYIRTSKRLKAHDEGNTKAVGDMVEIVPCRPISKDKRFMVRS